MGGGKRAVRIQFWAHILDLRKASWTMAYRLADVVTDLLLESARQMRALMSEEGWANMPLLLWRYAGVPRKLPGRRSC